MARLFVRLAIWSLKVASYLAKADDKAALGNTIRIHARLLSRLL